MTDSLPSDFQSEDAKLTLDELCAGLGAIEVERAFWPCATKLVARLDPGDSITFRTSDGQHEFLGLFVLSCKLSVQVRVPNADDGVVLFRSGADLLLRETEHEASTELDRADVLEPWLSSEIRNALRIARARERRWIRRAMNKANIATLAELAAKSGLDRKRLAAIDSGTVRPAAGELQRIATAIGLKDVCPVFAVEPIDGSRGGFRFKLL
jgi:hypothetical protein